MTSFSKARFGITRFEDSDSGMGAREISPAGVGNSVPWMNYLNLIWVTDSECMFPQQTGSVFPRSFFRAVTTKTARAGDSQFKLKLNDDLGITEAKWCQFVTYTFQGMVIERV